MLSSPAYKRCPAAVYCAAGFLIKERLGQSDPADGSRCDVKDAKLTHFCVNNC